MTRFVIIFCLIVSAFPLCAQEYVYPNLKAVEDGLLEYRRYTLEEAMAYEKGLNSFDSFLLTGWSEEIRLTGEEAAYRPRVATQGDSIFCSYLDLNPHDPYFVKSFDGGVSWSQSVTMADTARYPNHFFPEIILHNDELIIGCKLQTPLQGENLGYYRGYNYGESWSELIRVLPYDHDSYSNNSSICNVGERIYFSYNEFEHDSIYIVRSLDWGGSWNGRGVNVTYLNDTPQPMTVRASGTNVYLVWVNEVGTVSCRYSRSTDMGQTWSDEVDITNDSLGAQRVYIAVQDTHVVVCWMGYKYSPYSFTGDLFIRQSFDGGQTWGNEQVLTDLHRVRRGTIYCEDSLIVAVWMDQRYEGGGDEVMVRISCDYGTTWTDEERLSYGENHSYDPIACKTDDRVHVLWGDIRPNAPGLYYCYNDLATIIDEDNPLPDKSQLLSSYPNPFNSTTIITCSNLEGGDIEIYDITGRLVTSLNAGGIKEGKIAWDATDAAGEKVCSGIYFARARIGKSVGTPQGSISIKLILLK